MSCHSEPSLTPYPPLTDFPSNLIDLANIPAVVVGTLSRSNDVSNVYPSPWDGRLVKLVRIGVKVELVLKLDPYVKENFERQRTSKGEIPIYYFHYEVRTAWSRIMNLNLPRGWHLGDRMIFVLQSQVGKFRTVSDQWNRLPVVYTGAHPGYFPYPSDVAASMVDVLLTRGQNADDAHMLQAIDEFRLYYFNPILGIRALKNLENDPSLVVREAARQNAYHMLQDYCKEPSSAWAEACNRYYVDPRQGKR